MKVYVDSSALLRWLLQQPGRIEQWGVWERAVTSELTRVETRRSLDRLRVIGMLSDSDVAHLMGFLRVATAGFEEAMIRPPVLEKAGSPLPVALGTLDAIHLSTALLWMEDNGEPLTFLTHDRQLALAAMASGLDVRPSLGSPQMSGSPEKRKRRLSSSQN
jgi:predicted nucleic acid-binding protein